MRRPFLKLFTSDWRSAPELASCSLAARGLWFEMMCIMHEAQPYGYLIVGSQRFGEDSEIALARQVRATPKEARDALRELRDAGVYSIAEDGTIYSRRMVRDEQRRIVGQEHGKRGGNPLLLSLDNQRVNHPDNDEDIQTDNASRVRDQKPESRETQPPSLLGTSSLVDPPAGADAPPRELRPATEPFGFADWLFDLALELGIIGEHRQDQRDKTVRADLGAAKRLLDAYGLEECQVRARRLCRAIATGKLERTLPTVRALEKAWDYGCIVRDESSRNGQRGDFRRFGVQDPPGAYDALVQTGGES